VLDPNQPPRPGLVDRIAGPLVNLCGYGAIYGAAVLCDIASTHAIRRQLLLLTSPLGLNDVPRLSVLLIGLLLVFVLAFKLGQFLAVLLLRPVVARATLRERFVTGGAISKWEARIFDAFLPP
jgi:hypothetical protein